MYGNVPVRFGRGRLDSLVTKGLAAYLIATLAVWCLSRIVHDTLVHCAAPTLASRPESP